MMIGPAPILALPITFRAEVPRYSNGWNSAAQPASPSSAAIKSPAATPPAVPVILGPSSICAKTSAYARSPSKSPLEGTEKAPDHQAPAANAITATTAVVTSASLRIASADSQDLSSGDAQPLWLCAFQENFGIVR